MQLSVVFRGSIVEQAIVKIIIREKEIKKFSVRIKNLNSIILYVIAINMAKKDCKLLNINYEYLTLV